MRYAIVRNNTVENVVEWDGVTPWAPPAGATAMPLNGTTCSPGWAWANGAPVAPAKAPDPVPTYLQLRAMNYPPQASFDKTADWIAACDAVNVKFSAK